MNMILKALWDIYIKIPGLSIKVHDFIAFFHDQYTKFFWILIFFLMYALQIHEGLFSSTLKLLLPE